MKVQKYLEIFIENSIEKGETVILEGEHLDPSFLIRMITKYGNQCLCYFISLHDGREHVKRFVARGQQMTINPSRNKKVKNYEYIAEIQYYNFQLMHNYNEALQQSKLPEDQKNYITIIENHNIFESMVILNKAFQERIKKRPLLKIAKPQLPQHFLRGIQTPRLNSTLYNMRSPYTAYRNIKNKLNTTLDSLEEHAEEPVEKEE